ncbi:MAG: excisionase family DNA-binding protein [Desulfobacterales bacterium]|nr:excisionase family DNA-binding protein [Desulfobacterales bacterium]
MKKTLFSTPELATWLGVFHTTIRRWIEQGKIKGIRVGRNYKIPAEEVIRVLDDHEIPLPEILSGYKLRLGPGAKGLSPPTEHPGSILQELLIVEDIEDPAIICRKGCILGANQAFADLVDYSQEDLIGMGIGDVINESSEERLIDFAQRCLEQPGEGALGYVAYLRTDKLWGKKIEIAVGPLNHIKDVFLFVIKVY